MNLPPTSGQGANIWHGILTAAAVPLVTVVAWILAPETIKSGAPALTFLACWFICDAALLVVKIPPCHPQHHDDADTQAQQQ